MKVSVLFMADPDFDLFNQTKVYREFVKKKVSDEAVFVVEGLEYECLPAYPKEVYLIDSEVSDLYVNKCKSLQHFLETYENKNSREVIVFGNKLCAECEALNSVGLVYVMDKTAITLDKR